jgi:hypothetical protein
LSAGAAASIGAGEVARLAILVYCDFLTGPLRTWEGTGPLTLADGTVWQGNGGLVGVTDADLAAGFFASTLTLSLSGVPAEFDDIYARAMAAEDEVKGRRVVVSWLTFDAAWQPVGLPVALWAGVMDKLSFDKSQGVRSVSLQCETALVSRRKPRYAFLTDEDQQRRFSGDRGLRFASAAAEKQFTWPQY